MWKIFKKKGEEGRRREERVVKGIEEGKAEMGVPAPASEPSPLLSVVRNISPAARLAPSVFLHPVVSEKTSHAGAIDTYAFVVQPRANKIQVARAFAGLYKVKPISVRMMIVPAKRKRTGRIYGLRPAWKKALVRVPKGTKVDIFTGV